jgi:opacity protein-like surface antigen
MKRASGIAVLLLLCVSAKASAQYESGPAEPAQGDPDDRSLVPLVGFNIAGMASFPLGNSSDAFNPGGGFAAGIMFRPKPFIGIQFEYSYSWYDVKDSLIPGSNLDGLHTMQYWDLNIVARPAHAKHFGFYVIGGPGIYRRMVDITRFAGVGVSTYCDPILYYCYPAAVPVDQVLASRSSTDFGLNGGLGMYFAVSPPLRIYLEARFHYIWGPEFKTVGGKKRDADGQYIPITLGVAF